MLPLWQHMNINIALILTYTVLVSGSLFFEYLRLLRKDTYRAKNSRAILIDSFLAAIFILAPIAFYDGWKHPIPGDYPLQGNITQFIGTVLAIFFSLAVFPVQNLVNNTSFSLVERITKNEVFIKGFILLTLIFSFISIQWLLGLNHIVSQIHLAYLFMGIITFMFIVYESIRLIDVKNVISDYEKDAINILEYRWRKITSKTTDIKKQVQEMMIIKNLLTEETKLRLEPIFITTKKYISLDQAEVSKRGLQAMANIAEKYIDLFKFSVQDNDKLLLYLIERLIDFKKVLATTSHYSIAPKMVSVIKQIAIKSLEIKTPMSAINQSYLQLGLIDTLKDFVISKDILQETLSSPMDAIIALEEIGVASINQKNFSISHQVIEKLSEISVICTKLNLSYSNELSKEANRAILNLHYFFIKEFQDYKREIGDLLAETISKPIEAFIEVGDDRPMKGNLSPIIGTSVDPLNLTDFYSARTFNSIPYIIWYLLDKAQVDEDVVYSYIEKLFRDLNQLVMAANKKNMFFLTSEIVDTAFDVCFVLTELLELRKIKNSSEAQRMIDDRMYYIFLNAFDGSLTKNDVHFDEKLYKWFSAIGVYLITFQHWDGIPNKSVDYLMSKARSLQPNLVTIHEGHEFSNHEVAHDLQDIVEHINLALCWEENILRDHRIKMKLLDFTLSTQNQIYKHGYRSTRLPRPITSLGGNWFFMPPYVASYQHILEYFRIFLNVTEQESYEFDNFMERNEYLYSLIQMIKFHLGEIPDYDLPLPRPNPYLLP